MLRFAVPAAAALALAAVLVIANPSNSAPPAPQAGAGAKDESPVRKLDGGPLELTPVANQQAADDEIEVKGEYYPVLIHHKKQHEEPRDGEAKPSD